jgi:O-antigen/teichoic acid export membrane protein
LEDKSSYRQVMKATSLFGGVQVFNILIAIIRSKVIAVLLGPAGMGIAGLLSSTTGLVQGLTNFGLRTSAVRDISAANESGDDRRIGKVTTVFRRLVWITGLLGTIITFFLAPWLSELTFGNREYTTAFMWLSATLLLNQLASGQNVILQGTRKLKFLAKANLLGSIIGLLISVPFYYFKGIDGIVPALISASIASFLIALYFSSKVKIANVVVNRNETIDEGKGMLKMGIMLSLSGLIAMGVSYVVRIFISNTGDLDDVGLYNAGFAIIGTYVGLVFTAMGTDYYPRLSGIAHDNQKANALINQQAEVAILILAPILVVFITFISWIVILLYSTKFIPINNMIQWAALGMFFKAVSWSMAFILLAKGNSKLFFLNELIANIYVLGLSLLGYSLYGLDGLGISFLISYIIYAVQVYFLTKGKYQFSFDSAFFKIFGLQMGLGIICFVITKSIASPWNYVVALPFIALSIWYSFIELDKRLDLRGILINFKNNKKGER